jgi:DNA gyrase subunit B
MDDKHEPKRSAAEIVMTELHAGGKFDQNSYKVSGGLHGVGVSCVNALSKLLKLTVRRDGKVHFMEFCAACRRTAKSKSRRRGRVADQGHRRHRQARHGSALLADEEIFTHVEFHYEILAKRMRELSFLNNGVIKLKDQRTGKEEDFAFAGGTRASSSTSTSQVGPAPDHFQATASACRTRARTSRRSAMQWNDSYNEQVLCFTNNIPQRDGGTHLTGLRAAMTRVINKYIEEHELAKKAKVEVTGDDMREGLTCVLSVKVPEPQVPRRPRTSWSQRSARPSKTSSPSLTDFLQENPNEAKIDRGKIVEAARPRSRAQGPRPDPPQGRAGHHGPARQAGRLPGKGSGAVRTLHRRG